MKNKLVIRIFVIFGIFTTSCVNADTKSWREEVKLLDGRVIVVNQNRRYEGGYSGSDFGSMPRESWLTVNLPETGNRETTWHEKLDPSHINVVNGKLYIVAQPMTTREFDLYNQPMPPYIGYVFENKVWRRIPFNEIPVEMYNANLSVDSEKYIRSDEITLKNKEKEFEDPRMAKYLRRIDPNVKLPGLQKDNAKVY